MAEDQKHDPMMTAAAAAAEARHQASLGAGQQPRSANSAEGCSTYAFQSSVQAPSTAGLAGQTASATVSAQGRDAAEVSMLLPDAEGLVESLGSLRVGLAPGSETHRLLSRTIDFIGIFRRAIDEERKRAQVLYDFIDRERAKEQALRQRLDLARLALNI